MTVKGGHNYHENAYKTTFVNKIYMHNKEYFAIQWNSQITELENLMKITRQMKGFDKNLENLLLIKGYGR
jgi:hypothetical protein